MSGINKVILVGHLGKDPEFRYLQDNVAVLSFPLATSEFVVKNGIKTEHTDWHNIVMWRSLAEAGHKMLRKGKLVYVEGKARTRAFKIRKALSGIPLKLYPTILPFWGETVILKPKNYGYPIRINSVLTIFA